MKKQFRFLLVVVALVSMLISACGGAATADTSAGGDKPRASLVEFTGVIEAIDGNQWTINGVVYTISTEALGDDSFEVGDTIEVKAGVEADGTVIVERVSQPGSADDNSNDDNSNDDNSNDDNGNDDNSNDDNGNDDDSSDDNSNDDNGNDDNSNDDNGNDDDSSDDNSSDDNSNDDNGNDDDSGDDNSDDDNSGSDDDDDDDDDDDSNEND